MQGLLDPFFSGKAFKQSCAESDLRLFIIVGHAKWAMVKVNSF